ncbi:hypothetical protein BN946_scf185015.g11 [Trametes cinnabarina]|uniref:RBR-type E3 ubiquitin transferase n=1 Tax=Pycnoporus cinnabarinus TaxID=5643 RepID=A0A060SMN6_PYCCI|nr:hypothetical protein BN946_scf185015.g11 [Trametes cinnabarina]
MIAIEPIFFLYLKHVSHSPFRLRRSPQLGRFHLSYAGRLQMAQSSSVRPAKWGLSGCVKKEIGVDMLMSPTTGLRLPCNFSHDILDLAKLPADNELVIQHAQKIREALEAQAFTKGAGHASNASASTSPNAGKQRPRKPPKKPGASEASDKPSSGKDAALQNLGDSVKEAVGAPAISTQCRLPNTTSAYAKGGPRITASDQASQDEANKSSSDATYYSTCMKNPRPSVRALTISMEDANGPTVDTLTTLTERQCDEIPSRERERTSPLTEGTPRNESKLQKPQDFVNHTVFSVKNDRRRPQDVFQRSVDSMPLQSHTRHDLPPGAPTQTVPLVPPGLGLDDGTPRAPQSRPPPEVMTMTILDSTKVTFGPGFSILQVVTGFECLHVILDNVPSAAPPDLITTTMESFGKVASFQQSVSSPRDTTLAYKVTYTNGDDAAAAATAMNGKELMGTKIDAHLLEEKSTSLGHGTLYDGDVLFELPTPFQIGFVGYPTEDLAKKAIALAPQSRIGFSRITAELYTGIPAVGTYSVRFRGLPPQFSTDDLRKHFVGPLEVVDNEATGDGKKGRRRRGKTASPSRVDSGQSATNDQPKETCEGVMLQRAKYQSLDGAIQGLRRMLEKYDEDVSINVVPPPHGKYVRVWAHFTSPDIAAKACQALHRFCPQFVAKERIFARHIKSLRYALPGSIYDVLAPEINLLRSFIRDDAGTSITVIDKRSPQLPAAPVTVKLVSESMQSLTRAKTAFDRLLRGDKVVEDGQVVWSDFFGGPAGESFLRDLEQVHPNVKISADYRRRTLALFGMPEERVRVREEILAKVKILKARRTHRYPIPGDRIAGFINEGLAMLQRELGRENVWVDLTNLKLVVRGEEDAQKVAHLAVLHARQRAPRRGLLGGAECPVCFGEVSQPVALSCGHAWCKDCLAGYLNASIDNKSFPITCLADGARCAQPISLSIAQRLLGTDEFDAVVNAAFSSYVQERPKEFHYCPTPDCPQVYRKIASRKSKSALQCPSCLVRICPHCDMEYHETMSCQDRDPEAEMLFEEWKRGRDVKDCPNCKVPIERSAGCNHMTCVSCKIHICWACLETFPTSGEVYGHMRSMHGGIGL